jgi:hypothetical protein
VTMSWASFVGASWPGTAPADLLTMTFDIAEGASGSSAISFTSTSSAAGYTFDGQAHEVAISAGDEPVSLLDINEETGEVTLNGEVNPAQSDYSFTVTATDAAGYSSDQAVVVATYSVADADSSSEVVESPVSIPEVVANTQHVYVSSSTKSDDGTQEAITLSYNADANVTGLGFKVHYDSSVLTLSEITDVLETNKFIEPEVANVEDDTNNEDGNADTDKFINMAWSAFTSSTWPGSTPVDLLTMTFDIAGGASGSSVIGYSEVSSASGYTFDGQTHNIELGEGGPSGPASGTQVAPLFVADQVVDADASTYTGTAEADVFALADGSAEITSDAGEDLFILDPAFASASHTIADFESGVDAIDISAVLVDAGYTPDNAPTQLASAEMSADILDLVNDDASSLDNLFGATYDDASNTLTVFADSDSSVGATDMDSFQITLDDNATVDDDDIVASLSAFIA